MEPIIIKILMVILSRIFTRCQKLAAIFPSIQYRSYEPLYRGKNNKIRFRIFEPFLDAQKLNTITAAQLQHCIEAESFFETRILVYRK